MIIRTAQKEDSLDILNWRNDYKSYTMSLSNKKVGIKEHEEWFSNSLNDPNKKIFIGLIENVKIGVCRFDYYKDQNFSEVSINLNPAVRGRRYSYKFLSDSIKIYKKINSSILRASINKENIASIKIFEKCNFVKVSNDKKFLFYSQEIR
tara:strand:+ start:132 stop:581 length:450 start_codon:yes stop_codon:yes gene_type:complete